MTRCGVLTKRFVVHPWHPVAGLPTKAWEIPHAGFENGRAVMTRTTNSAVRTYVIDTSVLLSDPKAMFHFEEHHVVIPLTVITELEHKRKDPDLGFFARQALRLLDELIASHGDFPKPFRFPTPEARCALN